MNIAACYRGKLFASLVALLVVLSTPVFASFHLIQIEQVIGGVDGDTSAQAIQLRMRSPGQEFVSLAKLVVFDATGSNAITILDLTSDVANSAAGSRVLIVSSNFVNSTSPTTVPDFILTTPIPSSYLTAGRLAWEQDLGTIYWSLSWGGTNYTGPNDGNILNDNDGNFGPAFAGPLPFTSTSGLLFTNTSSASSSSNIVDYVVTSGPASFTNNAGTGFVVVSKPPVITAIARESNNIRLTWTTIAGRSNFVQVTAGDASGGFSNNFADVSSSIVAPGSGQVTTNYLDSGGATNTPSRFYRVRLVP